MKILIKPNELYKEMDNLRNINKTLDSNMYNIEKLILDIGYEWQGSAALAYQAKILYVKKQYQVLSDFINDYCYAAISVINDYEELEKNIKQQMEV